MHREFSGIVYFIQCSHVGLIKIGWTRNPPITRLQGIQYASPTPLVGRGFVRAKRQLVETEMHERFAPLRHRGEWFVPHERLTRFIVKHAEPWPGCERVGEDFVVASAALFLRIHLSGFDGIKPLRKPRPPRPPKAVLPLTGIVGRNGVRTHPDMCAICRCKLTATEVCCYGDPDGLFQWLICGECHDTPSLAEETLGDW